MKKWPAKRIEKGMIVFSLRRNTRGFNLIETLDSAIRSSRSLRDRADTSSRMEKGSRCGLLEQGVSLLEALVVLSIILVASATAIVDLSGSLRAAPADTAAQLVLQDMRAARQSAITNRLVYRMTFNTSPSSIAIDQLVTITTTSSSTIYVNGEPITTTVPISVTTSVNNISNDPLPTTIAFDCEPGIPLDPDGFGSGVLPVDFSSSNQIFFQPDGSGRDATGKLVNGVVYLAVPGVIGTSRSVTLWGSTGQIHMYKLYSTTSGYYWQ